MKKPLISTLIIILAMIGINIGAANAEEPAASQDTLLLGSAVYSDKSSHSGITITLSGHGIKQTAKTDKSGTFSFVGIAPGADYELEASANANYLSAKSTNIIIKSDGMNRANTLVLMDKPGTVTGTVILEGDDSHVGFIFEDIETGASLMQTNPALNGVFTFKSVPSGKRMIRLFKHGFESRLIQADIPANGTADLGQIKLSSHVGSFNATFNLEGSSAHDDIQVTLKDDKRSLYYSGKTDAKGRVKIEGILTGAYRLLARKTNFEELNIDSVVIAEGAANTLPNKTYAATILNKLKGVISGDVLLYTIKNYNDGDLVYKKTPCYGCFVFTDEGTMTISDNDGHFVLSGIANGDYSINLTYDTCITAQHKSYSTKTFSINETSPVHNFRSPMPMFEFSGTIKGVARLEGQTTHANIIVAIKGLTGYFTTTDAQGNYELKSVPVRNIPMTVVYSKANYAPVSLNRIYAYRDNLINTLPSVKLASSAK